VFSFLIYHELSNFILHTDYAWIMLNIVAVNSGLQLSGDKLASILPPLKLPGLLFILLYFCPPPKYTFAPSPPQNILPHHGIFSSCGPELIRMCWYILYYSFSLKNV